MSSSARQNMLIVAGAVIALAALIALVVPLAMKLLRNPGSAVIEPTPPPVETVFPVQAPAGATATVAPPRLPATATPEVAPASGQVEGGAVATKSPTAQVTATRAAPVEPTMTASVPTAVASGQATARVVLGPLNLRVGPGFGFGVVGDAAAGDSFVITHRSADGTWWEVCCFEQKPVWLAARYVTVTGSTENVPVGP